MLECPGPKRPAAQIPRFPKSQILKFLNSYLLKSRDSDTYRSIRIGDRLATFDHPDFHAALRGSLQVDFVYEVANEEDAAPAPFEEVFRRERIGDGLWIEATALIPDTDDHLGHALEGRREFDKHPFGNVVLVAVLDGV